METAIEIRCDSSKAGATVVPITTHSPLSGQDCVCSRTKNMPPVIYLSPSHSLSLLQHTPNNQGMPVRLMECSGLIRVFFCLTPPLTLSTDEVEEHTHSCQNINRKRHGDKIPILQFNVTGTRRASMLAPSFA